MAIAGFLGKYTGEVLVDGTTLKGPSYRRCRDYLGLVLEGRSVFPSLTVRQNLGLADADSRSTRAVPGAGAEALAARWAAQRRRAADVGAGARALGRHPAGSPDRRASFGLAPAAVRAHLRGLAQIVADTSMGVLLVEQHIHYAESVVDRALIMNEGLICAELPGRRADRQGSGDRTDLPRWRRRSEGALARLWRKRPERCVQRPDTCGEDVTVNPPPLPFSVECPGLTTLSWSQGRASGSS